MSKKQKMIDYCEIKTLGKGFDNVAWLDRVSVVVNSHQLRRAAAIKYQRQFEFELDDQPMKARGGLPKSGAFGTVTMYDGVTGGGQSVVMACKVYAKDKQGYDASQNYHTLDPHSCNVVRSRLVKEHGLMIMDGGEGAVSSLKWENEADVVAFQNFLVALKECFDEHNLVMPDMKADNVVYRTSGAGFEFRVVDVDGIANPGSIWSAICTYSVGLGNNLDDKEQKITTNFAFCMTAILVVLKHLKRVPKWWSAVEANSTTDRDISKNLRQKKCQERAQKLIPLLAGLNRDGWPPCKIDWRASAISSLEEASKYNRLS